MKYDKESAPRSGGPNKQSEHFEPVNFDLGGVQSPENLLSPYNWMSPLRVTAKLEKGAERSPSHSGDQSIQPDFITPVKKKSKRTRSTLEAPASLDRSPAQLGVENIDPDTPLIKRKLNTPKKQRGKNPHSIVTLLDRLSRFEYNRAYPRIRYRVQLEDNFGAYLGHLIDHDFYNAVNNRVVKDRPKSVIDEFARMIQSDLPSFEKIQKTADGLSRLFGVSQEENADAAQVAQFHPRQNRQPATFKKFVTDFRCEILALRDDVIPPRFRFVPRILNTSVENIVRPFLRELDLQSDENAQVTFSQRPENREGLLLAGLGSAEVEEFCLIDPMLQYWADITADIHPDIAEFLMASYSSKATHTISPNRYPFYLACALYEFQCDLTKIVLRLIEILEHRLCDFSYKNLSEALCVLWDPSFNTKEMMDRDFKAIHYLNGRGDIDQFLAGDHSPSSVAAKMQAAADQDITVGSVSIAEEQPRPRQSFLLEIQKKSFSELMETLFHSYGRLIVDFYDFVNYYNLAKAQQFVFSALSTLESVEESPFVSDYRCGLDSLDEAKLEFDRTCAYYHDISEAFVNELHHFNSIPSVHWMLDDFHLFFRNFFDPEHKIEPYPYAKDNSHFDEDWLITFLTKMTLEDNGETDHDAVCRLTRLLSHFRDELDKVYSVCEQLRTSNQKRQDWLNTLRGTRAVSDQLVTTSIPVLRSKIASISQKAENLQVKLSGGRSKDILGHELITRGLIDRINEVIVKIKESEPGFPTPMTP